MSDLIEFLLARIAEDEAIATAAAESVNEASHENRGEKAGAEWTSVDGMVYGQLDKDGYPTSLWDDEGAETLQMAPDAALHVARHDPARVLAECKAKRAIIAAFDPDCPDLDPYVGRDVLAMLATAFKDHTDYREEWNMA